MLTVRDEATERVSTAHRAKLAYIYVCQSSAGQVRQSGLPPWEWRVL